MILMDLPVAPRYDWLNQSYPQYVWFKVHYLPAGGHWREFNPETKFYDSLVKEGAD